MGAAQLLPRRRQRLRWISAIGAALLIAAPVELAACFSYPDTRERLDDDIILTRFDPNARFSSYATFTIRPDITLLDEADSPDTSRVLDASVAAPLIDAVARNMTSRGYVRVDDSETADLGIEIAITTELNAQRVCYPYGYRRAYWGYSGYSYSGYPYYAPWGCVTSVWTSGTVLIDLLDLRDAPPAPSPTQVVDGGTPALRAVWFAAIYRVLSARTPDNVTRAADGVDQAFLQSPYLRAGSSPP